MPDHINITHPDGRERWMRYQREIEKLKAELSLMSKVLDEAHGDLESIFTRIRNGDPVELHYPDGTMLIAVKGRVRGGGESPETSP